MKYIIFSITLIIAGVIIFTLSGCGSKSSTENQNNKESITPNDAQKTTEGSSSSSDSGNQPINSAKYTKISAKEAKDIIDTENNFVILDVRTAEEYSEKHIPKSILIPYDIIEKEAPVKLTNKNERILIYCRSGRRSAIAAESLLKMGYTNVVDFGGINDWPYETETGMPN